MVTSLAFRAGARVVAEGIARLSMFGFFLVMARVLGPQEIGYYAAVFSFLAIFMVISDLGLNLTSLREISRNPANLSAVLRVVVPLRIGLTALFVIMGYLATRLWTWTPAEEILIPAIIGFLAIGSLADGLFHLFQSFDWQLEESVLKIAQRTGTAAAGISILLITGSLAQAVWAGVLVQTILLLVGIGWFFVKIRKYRHLLEGLPDFQFAVMVRMALPLGLSAFLTLIYLRIDMVMMKAAGISADLIGQYQAVARIHDFSHTMSVLAFSTLVPSLNRWYAGQDERFGDWLNRSLRLLVVFASLIPSILFFMADSTFSGLFGEDFRQSGPMAQVLLWGLIPMAVNLVLLHRLLIEGTTLASLFATACSVIINVTGNYLLIPVYGVTGAAFSTLLSESGLMIVLLLLVNKQMKSAWKTDWVPSWLLLILFVMGCGYVLSDFPWMLNLILLPVLALLAARLLSLVTDEDWSAMKTTRSAVFQNPPADP
ncbi:MAG: flippase [Bacteroidetes bacterium]|nr:flippase [Bacteroidota bacterium]